MALAPDTTLWPFSHVVAFTRPALTEQTTPVSFTVVDAFANVSNVTFVDKDLVQTSVEVDPGGRTWTPALEMVVLYKVYCLRTPQGRGGNRWLPTSWRVRTIWATAREAVVSLHANGILHEVTAGRADHSSFSATRRPVSFG